MFNTFNTLKQEKRNYYRYCQNQLRTHCRYLSMIQRGKFDGDIEHAYMGIATWQATSDGFTYGLTVGNWLYHLRNLWDDVRLTLNLL